MVSPRALGVVAIGVLTMLAADARAQYRLVPIDARAESLRVLAPHDGAERVNITSAGPTIQLWVPNGVELYMPGRYTTAWAPVCQTPCTLYLEPGEADLAFQGPRYPRSSVGFTVRRGVTSVRLRWDTERGDAGLGLFMLGTFPALIGTALFVVCALADSAPPSPMMASRETIETAEAIGGAVALAGLGLQILGGYLRGSAVGMDRGRGRLQRSSRQSGDRFAVVPVLSSTRGMGAGAAWSF